MSHDDIRQRLAAIEHIDWSKVEHQTNEDHNGDWIYVDEKVLMYDGIDEQNMADFMQHAVADMRRLLAEIDADQTTREAIMPKGEVYGRLPAPDHGEPVRYLADAVEVLRPNGTVLRMDLIALADIIIKAERAVAGLAERNALLERRVAELEDAISRTRVAGRMLAGGLKHDDER